MRIWIYLVIFVFGILIVDGADVSVNLIGYNPRPVEQGKEFTLFLEVSNDEPASLENPVDVKIKVKNNEVFFVQGSSRKTISFIDKGEEEIEFRLLVDEDTELDEKKLNIEFCVLNDCDDGEFTIKIKQDASLIVDSVDKPNSFKLGQEEDVVINVKNDGDVQLKDLVVILDLSDVPFSVTEGKSQLKSLDSGEAHGFVFHLIALNNAEPGAYEIKYSVRGKNFLGEEINLNESLFLKIVAGPSIIISLGDDELIVGNPGDFTVNIVNKGLGDAKFVRIKALEGHGYDILSSSDTYIGDVDSSDFEVVRFKVLFSNKNAEFPIFIEYRDMENNLFNEIIKLRPNVLTKEEAIQLGLIKESHGFFYLIMGVVLVLIFIFWRKRKKRR